MEASQIAQRYIFSALLFLVLVWFPAVLYKYVHAAAESRWKLRLPLISCASTGVCDLGLFVSNEVQLGEDGISESPRSCLTAEGLTQARK